MIPPRAPAGASIGRGWPPWLFWIFAAVALLLLVLEHRAHRLGWILHVLLGLCLVVLYVASRAREGKGDGDVPR